jgi:hypothetical protein
MQLKTERRNYARNISSENLRVKHTLREGLDAGETENERSDSVNNYEDLVYSIFDLCYSIATGEGQSKIRE